MIMVMFILFKLCDFLKSNLFNHKLNQKSLLINLCTCVIYEYINSIK